jgi:hypothetical protein
MSRPDVSTLEQEVRENRPQTLLPDATEDLKQMLAGFMTAIQQSNKQYQETIRAYLNNHQQKAEQFQETVRADINKIRADLKAENEKLIQKFEQQTQEARNEFTS